MKKQTKLYRNLKPGDLITVTMPSERRSAVVTVTAVFETRLGWFSGRRQWAIHANYPWWFPGPITAYSDEKVEYIKAAIVERS